MARRYKGQAGLVGVADLEQTRTELTEWRRSHKPPTPIPNELWNKAVELAGRHGVGPTARRLGLDYAALKRRLGSIAAPAAFVELLPAVATTGIIAECALEVESARGARMRVLVKNVGAQGLASIIREFVG